MHARFLLPSRLLWLVLLGALFAGATGCRVMVKNVEAPAAASDSKTPAAKDPAAAEAEKAEKEAEEEAKDGRQLEKLDRDLAIARHRQERARMAQADDAVKKAFALTKLEKELGMEQERFQTFNELTVPSRIQRAQLDLLRAEDRTRDAEEELRQLELMYSEDDFADQTKEIVLDRGRRRLERSHTDLELRRKSHAVLIEKTIPMETRERQMGLEKKISDVEQARRDVEAMLLDHTIKLLSAESEITKTETDIKVLHEKIEKRRAKAAEAAGEKE